MNQFELSRTRITNTGISVGNRSHSPQFRILLNT